MSLLLSAALSGSTAIAAPTWRWTSTPVRYHAEFSTAVRQSVEFNAEKNISGRWTDLWVGLDTSCVGTPKKKGFLVSCELLNVQFAGKALRADGGPELTHTLEEWSARMEGTRVMLTVDLAGRVKKIDLIGIEGDDDRSAEIVDQMRITMVQAFRLFDLPLPTDDAEWNAGWTQKGDTPLFSLWSSSGSVGSWKLQHRPETGPGGQRLLRTEGKGTLQVGENIDRAVEGMIYVTVDGVSVFDEPLGLLTYRTVNILATTSNALSESRGDSWFTQSVTLSRLADAPPAAAAPADSPAPAPVTEPPAGSEPAPAAVSPPSP